MEPSTPLDNHPSSRKNLSPSKKPSTSKGTCRGCSQLITGKSIKAADGRLTGRYHKDCFVCKTCAAPFATADFYVHDNNPYCEQHYHQLNNSLCKCCDRGIEGQYLEIEGEQKFHPRCFTCSTCKVALRDDYFEFGGMPYCQRHAMAAMNAPAPKVDMLGVGMGMGGPGAARRFPERRTTKLMMM